MFLSMSHGEEYSDFQTDISQMTVFDQAQSTEALKLKAKNTKTGRGRSRNGVCRMLVRFRALLLRSRRTACGHTASGETLSGCS